jgi:Asp-tRNA(Asn)/Glu-tRNA(Gln) amidotransferase A subunit family amidase
MSHTFINGFSGTVLCGAFVLDVTEWSADVEVEILDTTNTGDLGWQSNINGCKKATGSCKTFWDTATVPTGSSGGAITNGASVTLTLNIGSSGRSIVVPARVGKITVSNPVKGVVPFEFSYESNGVVTLPT